MEKVGAQVELCHVHRVVGVFELELGPGRPRINRVELTNPVGVGIL